MILVFLELVLIGGYLFLLIKIISVCIVVAVAVLSFYSAFQIGGNSSQVVALSLTDVIVAVFFSLILLKEKENIIKKLIAAILSFVGVLLLS